MTVTVTGFSNSPDRGQGLARDMRIRWALEEVGQPYDMRLLTFAQLKEPAHLALQPFGQIPTYQDGDLTLFETGAIVLHIAESNGGLLPADGSARIRAINWIFAALNTVEPPIIEYDMALMLERDEDWFDRRLPMLEQNLHNRLGALSDRLGNADWLDGDFSAGDLMMIHVLLRLKDTPPLSAHPGLVGYIERGEARPAYQRAFADQRAVFEAIQKVRP